MYTPLKNPLFDESFKKHVETKITEFCLESEHDNSNDPLEDPFEVSHVAITCSKLPNGKSSGIDGVVNEHLKYADESLFIILTKLFNVIRLIEDVPVSSTIGMIVSLFKGKTKNRLDKSNYHGITLLNVLGKLFERLLLDRMMPILEELNIPHPLQYAYQPGKSCNLATFTLQESALHNVERGSKVYACFLDSSKAFDTVWFNGLFYKLYNMGIRGKTWCLLRAWYSKLSACVALNDRYSDHFPIKQGVRQGAVLSPWLFLVYNNDIPMDQSLVNNSLAVDMWSGCVMVADDIAFLSTRVIGLQLMLNAVNKYSKVWRFEFNPGKTVEVTFGELNRSNSLLKSSRNWTLGVHDVKEERTWEHVGNVLSGSFSNVDRCEAAVKKGKEVVSCLLSSGARPGGLNPICSAELWRTVGLPRMLYGAELWWGLKKSDIEKLETANKFAAKRIQGLQPNTRSAAAVGSLGM